MDCFQDDGWVCVGAPVGCKKRIFPDKRNYQFGLAFVEAWCREFGREEPRGFVQRDC